MLLPGLVWLGLIGTAALFDLLHRPTLSQWVWHVRRRFRWFGFLVAGLLIVLAVHLLWPEKPQPPDPPDVPQIIIDDEGF